MKKILTMAVALVMAVCANAQNPDKGISFAAEMGVGSELEIGVRGQYNFNKYIALDLPVLKYAYDYGDFSVNEITIQVGARAFSPTFGPDMKAFAALDLGYGNMFKDGVNTSACAIDFTMGLYVWKGLYLGYGYGALCKDGHHNDHLFRIGYNFTF